MKTLKKTSFLPMPALGLIAVLGVAPAVQSAPALTTTAQGRGADLNIRGGNVFGPGNFGDHEVLRVRNSADLGSSRKSYLRFDLTTQDNLKSRDYIHSHSSFFHNHVEVYFS